ncbi:hypothetical protein OTU49_006776, partial [Cherax quadricarinatus]
STPDTPPTRTTTPRYTTTPRTPYVKRSVEGKEKIDQCKSCSVVRCAGGPETMKCTYGIVKDWCGCCYTCGLGPGSPCGRDVGVCGTGLVCRNGTCVLSRIRQG